MNIAEELLDTVRLLSHFIVPRYITGEVIRFAEREGILELLSEMKTFSFDTLNNILQDRMGYKLDEPVRQKMIANLIRLLSECGYLSCSFSKGWDERVSGGYKDIEEDIVFTDEEKTILNKYFEDQTSFIKRCVDYAPIFLKGGPHLYSFNGNSLNSLDVWDSFLGSVEFSFARHLLLLNLNIKDTSDFKLLDIGYGPGYGVISARKLYPAIDITAIDFAGSFTSLVKEKIDTALHLKNGNARSIKLISNGGWKGFGHTLPFSDDCFDTVFFTCADPYIPPHLREWVYREIYRVLKYNGSLGILTRAYPDPEFRYVKNKWTRRATYCHDFAESVCKGWYGFYDVEESFRLFKKIGFSKNKETVDEMCMLDSAIWILDKN